MEPLLNFLNFDKQSELIIATNAWFIRLEKDK